MIHYITITKQEKNAIIVMTVILMLTNIFLCFKGMQLMRKNADLLHEKQVLEEIMEVQKEQLEAI